MIKELTIVSIFKLESAKMHLLCCENTIDASQAQ